MKKIKRREFISKSAMGVPMAAFLASSSLSLANFGRKKIPMGASLFGSRHMLIDDFPGTLKKVYDLGYRALEYHTPQGALPMMKIEPLAKLSAKEVRQMVDDAGLRMVSSHYVFAHLKEHIDEHIEYAVGLGLEHIVIAHNGRHDTLDAWKERADEMNKLGEKTAKAGIKLGFHNHGNEFDEIDGVVVYDMLMNRIDPENVGGQLHMRDPAPWIRKYPNRILSLHFAGDYNNEGDRGLPIGQGVTDWQEILTAAKKNGVPYYFVEMDMKALIASAPYVRKLKH